MSSCITLYDDQLLEGDEVFSVLLNIPNVTTLEPGLYMLATVTIKGMYVYVCMYVCMYVCIYVHMCIHTFYTSHYQVFSDFQFSFCFLLHFLFQTLNHLHLT